MKIIVFGASGRSGIEVCKQATQKGMNVIGFDLVKSAKLNDLSNFMFIKGSVLDKKSVIKAVRGVDGVVSELGVKLGNINPVISCGNQNIITAMKANRVERLITQSAFGALESWQHLPFYYKLLHKYMLGQIASDKNAMEEILMASKIDWTIIRPVRLTKGPMRANYRVGNAKLSLGLNPRISRADVAHFIINELQNNRYIRKAITITY